MSYQVKRSAKVEEDLELLSADGKVSETIHVKLDADAVAVKASKNYTDLLNLQSRLARQDDKEDKAQLLGEIGKAVVILFKTIFGEEDTDRILRFYENDYIDMCRTIMPFITDVVIPEVRKEAQKSRKSKMRSYDRKKGFMRMK